MDIAALRGGLAPLASLFGNPVKTPSQIEQQYFAFYGIDLENQLSDVSHEFGSIESCGYTIACHIYRKERANGTLFLLHGYYDHAGLYSHILRFLLEQDFNVLVYDLPGHGLTSGKPATISDFSVYTQILEDILSLSQNNLPEPWHAYGQSTGCAILTDFHLSRAGSSAATPFDKVIYSAPLVRPWLWSLSRIQLYLARPFIRQLPRNYTDNSRNREFLELAHNDPMAPDVLPTEWVSALDRWIRKTESSRQKINVSPIIIQGTYDRTVDAKHNIGVLKRLFTQPEVLYLEDARHHLPNELEETRQQYMNWLASFIQQE